MQQIIQTAKQSKRQSKGPEIEVSPNIKEGQEVKELSVQATRRTVYRVIGIRAEPENENYFTVRKTLKMQYNNPSRTRTDVSGRSHTEDRSPSERDAFATLWYDSLLTVKSLSLTTLLCQPAS